MSEKMNNSEDKQEVKKEVVKNDLDNNSDKSIAQLATALSKFQGDVENAKKTSENPFFKSSYAPLEEVLDTVRPVLAKYGLSIIQIPITNGAYAGVKTILMHESGEKIEAPTLFLLNQKGDAQGAGGAITYARRYALSSILGIASEEDDDGNSVSVGGDGSYQHLMKRAKQLGTKYYNADRMEDLEKITNKYFGKGNKLMNATPQQLNQLNNAVKELENGLNN